MPAKPQPPRPPKPTWADADYQQALRQLADATGWDVEGLFADWRQRLVDDEQHAAVALIDSLVTAADDTKHWYPQIEKLEDIISRGARDLLEALHEAQEIMADE